MVRAEKPGQLLRSGGPCPAALRPASMAGLDVTNVRDDDAASACLSGGNGA